MSAFFLTFVSSPKQTSHIYHETPVCIYWHIIVFVYSSPADITWVILKLRIDKSAVTEMNDIYFRPLPPKNTLNILHNNSKFQERLHLQSIWCLNKSCGNLDVDDGFEKKKKW